MSMSISNSNSTSTPVVTQTPQNAILDQISQYAQGLAGQMYSWAQSTFAHTSQITDQAVGNFFNVSQKMQGLSDNLTGQYNNLFAPENAQLVADANSYASPARMAVDMGQAGATQAQSGEAALAKTQQDLQSYGIDPSSGRYAALDKAAAVQNSANIAGAENTQRNADIATGQKLRSEAVQVGAQLPAAIANVNNTMIQANTGAANATDANANTGANLMKVPNDYLNTAMALKLPLQGQNSQSTSQGSSSSPNNGGSKGGGGGGGSPGGGGGGSSPSGPAWGMNMPTGNGSGGGGGGGNFQGGSSVMQTGWGNGQPDSGVITGADNPMGGGSEFGNSNGQDWGNGNTADPNTFGGGDTSGYNGMDFTGGGTSGGSGSDMSGLGAYGYDPNANTFDPSSAGGWQDPAPQMSDPNVFSSGSGVDYSGISQDPGFASDPFSSAGGVDLSGGSFDPSQMTDLSGGDYARGGAISPAGKQLSPQLSPSGGRQVDDIPAQGPGGQQLRMNANEFVIPQDVALWKGQEFFQNLIDQSRKRRVTASAQPTPMRT